MRNPNIINKNLYLGEKSTFRSPKLNKYATKDETIS